MDASISNTTTIHIAVDPDKKVSTKKYRESILKEIIPAICALLNRDGGTVVCSSQMSSVIRRKLEQSMISIIGSSLIVSNINFEEDKKGILVSKAGSFITTDYNLYLPSQLQVVQVLPWEPLEKVKDDIINRKVVPEPVQLGSHCQVFRKGEGCGFHENKMRQLKHLKAGPSKRTTLADRMTGKGNKLSCYVSAFANYNGGHIYYGIRDDGVVEGELISSEDIIEITKKVEKAIKKMIWPEQVGQPKRGVHWEIFFQPVVDESSKPILSTFVIVIYIAPCLGGVFTEEPECYEMVEGEVKKMSFTAWKKRISGPVESVPHVIGSNITWISKRIEKLCTKAFCDLTLCLNNGDLEGYAEKSKDIVQQYPDIVELKLVVLLKDILARSRKHNFKTADGLLEEYNNLLPHAKEHRIFEVLGLYVEAAYHRPKGNEDKALNRIRDLLVSALAKSEWLIPGLATVLVCLFAGTMTGRFDDTFFYSAELLSHNALQHLQEVMPGCPEVRADLEDKAHITLATFHLGCNLSGELVAKQVDDNCVNQANSSIMAIEQSERKLTHYREVQLNLVKSIYYFRRSENQPKERMRFMREAFEYSKKSENLAREWKFYEMVSWSKSLQGLITEKLVRAAKIRKPQNYASVN
jgi:hypothetical protein